MSIGPYRIGPGCGFLCDLLEMAWAVESAKGLRMKDWALAAGVKYNRLYELLRCGDMKEQTFYKYAAALGYDVVITLRRRDE